MQESEFGPLRFRICLKKRNRILGYDASTYLLILADPPQAVLVDISICLDPSQSLPFLKELRGNLMVMGTVEYSEVRLTPFGLLCVGSEQIVIVDSSKYSHAFQICGCSFHKRASDYSRNTV